MSRRNRRSILVPALMLGLAVAVFPMAGCEDTPTSPTSNVPFSQADLTVGTGAEATAGKLLTVNYTGWLYDANRTDQKGTQFDSSIGRAPYSFTLGAAQVIAGWDQGLVGMKVGGVRRLVIPPNLAYGASGNGPIPPNATLVFEVALLAVE